MVMVSLCNQDIRMKSVIIFMLLVPLAFASHGKVLLFPKQSDTSYVTIKPLKSMDMQAFTLCMRLASELGDKREIILFSYYTPNADELNVWRDLDGSFSFYLGSSEEKVAYVLPQQLNTFQTHMCVTWDSSSGLGAFWVNAHRSISKVYKPGYSIKPDGTIVLGQYPKTFQGGFDAKQSFVGEISDVNLWDRVLNEDEIKKLYNKSWEGDKGNVINWDAVQYSVHGNVITH